jgi:hypothetical protein
MSDSEWTDLVVGERMQVDQEFNEKVAASNFSRQQWGLIMTAVEFDVENPDDADRARLVADTGKVETIIPELEKMEQAGGMGGPGGAPAAGSGSDSGSGGLVDGLKNALGLSGGGDESREQLAAAEELAQMYAGDLQEKLEATGKWEQVRTTAADET